MHYAFFIWNSVYHKISRQNPIDENASFEDVLTCVTGTQGQVLKSVSVHDADTVDSHVYDC